MVSNEQMLIDIAPIWPIKDEINYSHKDAPDVIATDVFYTLNMNQKIIKKSAISIW